MSIAKVTESISRVDALIEKNGTYKNVADRFLPIGPQTADDQKLNWGLVYKSIIESSLGLQCDIDNWSDLRLELLKRFKEKRETRDLADLVDTLYLNQHGFKGVTPLSYLICNEKQLARTKTMISVFNSMLYGCSQGEYEFEGNNFIECLINEHFYKICSVPELKEANTPYLPFLAECFRKDIEALRENTEWFVEEFENLIELYAFLYLTQLTINIASPNYRYKKPKARPLYFILENEKASQERHECKTYGFNYVFSKNTGLAWSVFPFLGYLDWLTEQPLWELIETNQEQMVNKVNEFNQKVSQMFSDVSYVEHNTIEKAINHGLATQISIFKISNRSSANEKLVAVYQDVFARNFKTDRKAAGKYFELKSNTVLLLTNLVIGKGNKMLIDDVIEEFKERGIWLDIKSKNTLLKFYEHIGNIEKLSDSGDAVYVKSTI